MTGVKGPIGVVGAAAVGGHAAGALPFTGAALGVYALAGGALLLTGVALRFVGRARKN